MTPAELKTILARPFVVCRAVQGEPLTSNAAVRFKCLLCEEELQVSEDSLPLVRKGAGTVCIRHGQRLVEALNRLNEEGWKPNIIVAVQPEVQEQTLRSTGKAVEELFPHSERVTPAELMEIMDQHVTENQSPSSQKRLGRECDFCSETVSEGLAFDNLAFVHRDGGGVLDVPRGCWLGCPSCAELFGKQRFRMLAQRSVERVGDLQNIMFKERLYRAVWLNLYGKARRVEFV